MQSNNNPTEPSALRRNAIVIVLIAIVAIGGTVWIAKLVSGPKPKANKAQEFSLVQVALPPPPPPPPPKNEPPKPEPVTTDNDPMIAPDPVAANEPPPADAPADAASDSSMGSNIQGDGSADGFGLVGRGSGGIIGGRGTLGGGAGGSGAARWAPYATQVQRTMEDALRRHEKTRLASLRITLRVWPGSNGEIERVQLSGSTGDAELDKALQNDIFKNLQLQSPPPADMPRPIVMRITAQRPR